MTAEDYYLTRVNNIISTVVEALEADPKRKFSQTEIYYFNKWWTESADDKTKLIVKKLVKQGRFEFLNGGWVASDEACPTFEDLILNIATGHEFLRREFGVIPKIAWHCDPFGHSAAVADLFSQIGFEAMFFSRIDDDEKDFRKKN